MFIFIKLNLVYIWYSVVELLVEIGMLMIGIDVFGIF